MHENKVKRVNTKIPKRLYQCTIDKKSMIMSFSDSKSFNSDNFCSHPFEQEIVIFAEKLQIKIKSFQKQKFILGSDTAVNRAWTS